LASLDSSTSLPQTITRRVPTANIAIVSFVIVDIGYELKLLKCTCHQSGSRKYSPISKPITIETANSVESTSERRNPLLDNLNLKTMAIIREYSARQGAKSLRVRGIGKRLMIGNTTAKSKVLKI